MRSFRARFVVVGSGPTAYGLTTTLLTRGESVLVVPGGSLVGRQDNQDLLRGEVDSRQWSHEPLDSKRRMGVGGTGNWWGGRSVLLDPTDFERRRWVPNSGWPVSYEDYIRFLPHAARTLDIHSSSFTPMGKSQVSLFGEHVRKRQYFVDDGVEVWSTATNFARKWASLVRNQRTLSFLDGAVCTGIVGDSVGNVGYLNCWMGSEECRVEGSSYILATGGMENARLLLLAGLGNYLPALGRYYQAHIWADGLDFGGRELSPGANLVRRSGSYCRRRWRLRDDVQEEYGLANGIAFAGRSAHRIPVPALVRSRNLLRGAFVAGQDLVEEGNTSVQLAFRKSLHGERGLLTLLNAGIRTVFGLRPPTLLPSAKAAFWSLNFQGEHVPNASSRLELSDRTDRFGNPRLRVRVDFSELDFRSVAEFYRLFGREAASHGFFCRPYEVSAESIRERFKTGFNSGSHHIGATRMGTSRTLSVVDPSFRVHGTTNLFCVGSSIFPTSGHANPTLSAVMLAHRLGTVLSS